MQVLFLHAAMSTVTTSNKKILIITYYWPPAGGPGVQRWLKFTKYMPEHGYTPFILTVDENLASYPINDKSLENEISPEVQVYRTKTRELFNLYLKITGKKNVPFSGFVHEGKASLSEKLIRFVRTHLFIPDPRKGWNRYALRKAIEIIKQERITYIVTTSPPHSTQLIGLKLKKIFPSITWMADFRDSWNHVFYLDQLNHSFFSKLLHRKLEEKIVVRADKVITVTNSWKNDFIEDYKGKITGEKITVIPNGYDEDDFKGEKPPLDKDITITYTGTLADNYRIDDLIQAVSEINRVEKKKIKLRFVGEICNKYQSLARHQLGDKQVEIFSPVSHSESINYLFRSHILLLVNPDAPNNASVIPGKLFEYMAAKRPIIGIGPAEGDVAAILEDTRAGKMIDYNNPELIKAEILRIYNNYKNYPKLTLSTNVEFFSRRMLTSKLLSIFG